MVAEEVEKLMEEVAELRRRVAELQAEVRRMRHAAVLMLAPANDSVREPPPEPR